MPGVRGLVASLLARWAWQAPFTAQLTFGWTMRVRFGVGLSLGAVGLAMFLRVPWLAASPRSATGCRPGVQKAVAGAAGAGRPRAVRASRALASPRPPRVSPVPVLS